MIGWDIGGVNTKVALVARGEIVAVRAAALRAAACSRLTGACASRTGGRRRRRRRRLAHAVTMTAELSQMFRTKREGVAFVLDAVQEAFRDAPIHVFTVDGRFLTASARRGASRSLVAAANWVATASVVAQHHPDSLLIDVGTTTTDIIPIVGGRVAALGRTDPERLGSGELVYTGAVRTPVEAIVQPRAGSRQPDCGLRRGIRAQRGRARLAGRPCRGRVHAPRRPTGGQRPASYAGERLAAGGVRRSGAARRGGGVGDRRRGGGGAGRADCRRDRRRRRTRIRRSASPSSPGSGAFIGAAAARVAGLTGVQLSARSGTTPRAAPRRLPSPCSWSRRRPIGRRRGRTASQRSFASRCKRLRRGRPRGQDGWSRAGAILGLRISARGAGERRFRVARVIVPGGGPFADAVRERGSPDRARDDEAHWMAVRAMDQFAELLVSRLRARRPRDCRKTKSGSARGRARAGARAVSMAARGGPACRTRGT